MSDTMCTPASEHYSWKIQGFFKRDACRMRSRMQMQWSEQGGGQQIILSKNEEASQKWLDVDSGGTLVP